MECDLQCPDPLSDIGARAGNAVVQRSEAPAYQVDSSLYVWSPLNRHVVCWRYLGVSVGNDVMYRLEKDVEITGNGAARPRQMRCGLMVAVGVGLLLNCNCVLAELDASRILYHENYDELLAGLEEAGNAVAQERAARSAQLGTAYHKSEGFLEQKFGDETQVRGWEVLPKTYVGQTKVLDSWGVGIVIEKDDYVLGINNRRLSIGTKF